jgi:hypothetical protein
MPPGGRTHPAGGRASPRCAAGARHAPLRPAPPLPHRRTPQPSCPPRLLLLLAAAATLPRGAHAASLNGGLNFSPDPRSGGLANNPQLIVFIVFISLLGCSCVMCAIGFAKFDWLRVLIKGEEPSEVDLLGPPPPEPQNGRGNWVVRPRGSVSGRIDTAFDDDVEAAGGGAWRAGGATGYGGDGGSSYDDDEGASSFDAAAYATEEEAAAAWLRARGRGTLAAPPVPRTERSGRSARSDDGYSEASGSARAAQEQRARAQQQAPAEVAAARAFLADARGGAPRHAQAPSASALSSAPSSAASASSWWSRFVPTAAGEGGSRWLGAPPPVAAVAAAASAAAPTTSFGARASLWGRVRAARADARPPPDAARGGGVALRSPPSDVRAAAAWLGTLDDGSGAGAGGTRSERAPRQHRGDRGERGERGDRGSRSERSRLRDEQRAARR